MKRVILLLFSFCFFLIFESGYSQIVDELNYKWDKQAKIFDKSNVKSEKIYYLTESLDTTDNLVSYSLYGSKGELLETRAADYRTINVYDRNGFVAERNITTSYGTTRFKYYYNKDSCIAIVEENNEVTEIIRIATRRRKIVSYKHLAVDNGNEELITSINFIYNRRMQLVSMKSENTERVFLYRRSKLIMDSLVSLKEGDTDVRRYSYNHNFTNERRYLNNIFYEAVERKYYKELIKSETHTKVSDNSKAVYLHYYEFYN